MLFKNLQMFRLTESINLATDEFETKLRKHKLKPCPATALFNSGWVSPFGNTSKVLAHSCNGYLLFSAARNEKILPAGVINAELEEKAKHMEDEYERKIFAKEKKSIRDQVIFDLLPKAFVQQKITHAYIDSALKLLIINTNSHNRAENLTILLRESLGTLPIARVETKQNASLILTDWLAKNELPRDFALADQCEMMDVLRGQSIIRCSKQDLTSREIANHLKAGKQITKLGLIWQDKISFVINSDLNISRIRYLDIWPETDATAEDKSQIVDADFAIMTSEFNQLLKQLFAALGGLVSAGKSSQKKSNVISLATA